MKELRNEIGTGKAGDNSEVQVLPMIWNMMYYFSFQALDSMDNLCPIAVREKSASYYSCALANYKVEGERVLVVCLFYYSNTVIPDKINLLFDPMIAATIP